ncbi:hypothetical protein CEXT_774761 [Caerostris extrusa]|uniref:Uncharacterized protein n=1 Tax=Caerostris extrusa TaxID=172846 RepID=A0AAV4VLW1_CAEEX|nr:hypothetical protein CEXT_774761 [Caerostris extrusa]
MISTSDVHSKTNGLGKKRKGGRPNGIHILQDIDIAGSFRWNRTEGGGQRPIVKMERLIEGDTQNRDQKRILSCIISSRMKEKFGKSRKERRFSALIRW